MKNLLLVLSFSLLSYFGFSQGNNTCANAQPFCTGNVMNFPAGVNAGQAQNGPNYGCLFSQPNPAWFYMQIATGGPLVVTMSAGSDIDFICWGPFPSLAGACNSLTAGNTVDCSYSGSNTETCTITNAIPGQFYLLLITNFANVPQNITFQQQNAGQPGAATTNCGVLCSMTVTGTSSLCSGNSATLSAVAGTNITNINWLGPSGYSSFNNPTPTVPSLTATGVYTAIATTTGTNPATNTCAVQHSITVVANPTPALNNNGPICANATANLNAAGGGTYLWSGPAAFTSTLAAPTITNAQTNNSGVYTVTVTLNTCTAAGTTSLTVKANPTVTAANSGSYCEGQSFNLLGGGASTYSWTGPSAFSSPLQSPVFTNNNLGMSGTYSLLGTTNGCTAFATTDVTIYALPNITVTSSGDVCQNTPLTLSAGGGTSYVWTGPAGFNSNMATITTPSAPVNMTGTYMIVGTDINGCKNTATLTQLVYPTPIPVAMGAKSCLNEELHLAVSGGTSYLWSGPLNFTSTSANPVISPAHFGHVGNYTVVVTGPGSCTAGAVVSTTVFPNPVISYTGTGNVCKGDIFKFTGQGGVTYKWLDRNGIISNTPSFSISSVDPGLVSTYTLIGFDVNSCPSTVVINPNVLPLPVARIIPSPGNCVPFTASFVLEKISPNITNATWALSNGEFINDTAKVLQQISNAGVHMVKADLIDANGCKSSITHSIEGYPVPEAAFEFSNSKPTELESDITFMDNSKYANIVGWYWDFKSNGIHTSEVQHPTFNYGQAGQYLVYLKVTSDHGCTDSILKLLTVEEDLTFYIPNSFTPNGDNVNDVFTPKGVGITKYRMDIFDRWGELLFTSTDINVGWDGKNKKGGVLVPQDVYVYKIVVSQKEGGKAKEYTGHVTLMK